MEYFEAPQLGDKCDHHIIIENGFLICETCGEIVSRYFDFLAENAQEDRINWSTLKGNKRKTVEKLIFSVCPEQDSEDVQETINKYNELVNYKTLRGNGCVKRSLIAACYHHVVGWNKERVKDLFKVTQNQFNKALKRYDDHYNKGGAEGVALRGEIEV